MHDLLQIQLKKIYGKDFNLSTQDKQLQDFIKIVNETYLYHEEEGKLLEDTLVINAKELEKSNHLLLQQKELLENVENSMDDAIFYKNLNHQYIGGNSRFLEFLGISEKQLIGKSDYDFFDTQTASHYKEINEKIIQEGKKVIYKHWVNLKEEEIYVLTIKTALLDIEGSVIGIVGIARDITHEYELQQEIEHKNIMLIQQNKLVSMGEMIANIAHQWRQPLNTLSLLIQKLGIFYNQGLLDSKKVNNYVSEAMFITQEMSETIDDFRSFFSPNRVLKDFNVKESILKAMAIIKPIIEDNNITFILDIKKRYSISGYKNEFFQVVFNLLNNAVEALIANKITSPLITVSATVEESNVLIDICDNANGINSSLIDKIFDPYFTTKERGTGLGLYMSKIIIEEHMSGKLSVKSNYFGTTVTIQVKKSERVLS